MKKTILLITALLFSVAQADLTAVSVPPEMLHAPSGGLGYLGKVDYTLVIDKDALGLPQYDSIFVKLEIVPVEGGAPLQLDAVEGAVGVVHILPKEPQRTIWFRYSGPVSGQYIAKVTVDAIETTVLQKTKVMVNEASVSQMVAMFSGISSTAEEGVPNTFFEQVGMTTPSGSLKNIRSADGPHGLNGRRNGEATAFLTCGGMACTWDVDAAFEQGVAMGEEFRKDGRNVCLGPSMNIVWHPQGGRAFEYYSEDSYLSGKMAAAAARGLQSRGVIAAAKHYTANNKENNRENLDAKIDERSLQELFLPQFKMCVIEGGALGVMTAYNMVNGQYCTDSKYLVEDLLRNTWGFMGYTMSDWDAKINSMANAVMYGADQLLPTVRYSLSDFSDVTAKNKAKHIIYANGKVGLLDPGYNHYAYQSVFMSQEKRELVRRLGARAIVLAKNEGNTLPIPKTGKKIMITGPDIDIDREQSQYNGKNEHEVTRLGGGDSYGWESSLVSPPSERRISPSKGITDYINGLTLAGKNTITNSTYDADYILVAIGAHYEGEGMDRPDLRIYKDEFVQNIYDTKLPTAKVVILYTGGSASLPGAWSNADAILICFGPGQEQGYSMADVLFGDVCPGGKLNVTFPRTENQAVNFQFQSGTDNLNYPPANQAHGYFRVDYLGEEPLFAFGHGLSYTTFAYTNLLIYPAQIQKGDRVYVSVDVTNTGAVTGDEVVQLYLSLPTGTVPVRKQDLRGFDRITLQPGETQKVLFALNPEDMAYFKVGAQEYDGTGKWDILSGTYSVRVGTSSKITPQPDQPSVSGTFVVN